MKAFRGSTLFRPKAHNSFRPHFILPVTAAPARLTRCNGGIHRTFNPQLGSGFHVTCTRYLPADGRIRRAPSLSAQKLRYSSPSMLFEIILQKRGFNVKSKNLFALGQILHRTVQSENSSIPSVISHKSFKTKKIVSNLIDIYCPLI